MGRSRVARPGILIGVAGQPYGTTLQPVVTRGLSGSLLELSAR